ncbi:MAG TPA: methyltransferase domain-containing protein [Planctomycetaceae bacterium]
MITHPEVTKSSIRRHYDLLSPFYRLLWGRHIHHGLWDETDGRFALPPAAAQLRLTEALADAAGVTAGDDVLDVGCGLGGSAIHLAKTRGCRVTGVTLSGTQRLWASLASQRHGVADRTRFLRADAETVAFEPAGFDVLWSVECTEHLFDKPRFFRSAATWLKPGGRLAVCAWLAGDEPLTDDQRRTVERVCEGMFCPSLGAAADYETWFRDTGLTDVETRDWTARVARTWEICLDRVRRTGAGRLAPLFGRDAKLFVSRFETMITAYRTGAMRYAAFTARKRD